MDRPRIDAFAQEVDDRRAARREMQIGAARDAAPEPLLGERIAHGVGAQSGLDVRDPATRVAARPRAGVGGERVALHDRDRRPHAGDDLGEWPRRCSQAARRFGSAGSAGTVGVAADAETGERLAHRARMLAAVDDVRPTARRAPASARHDRRELDAFRSRAGDHQCHARARRRLARRGHAHARSASAATPVVESERFPPIEKNDCTRGGPLVWALSWSVARRGPPFPTAH